MGKKWYVYMLGLYSCSHFRLLSFNESTYCIAMERQESYIVVQSSAAVEIGQCDSSKYPQSMFELSSVQIHNTVICFIFTVELISFNIDCIKIYYPKNFSIHKGILYCAGMCGGAACSCVCCPVTSNASCQK